MTVAYRAAEPRDRAFVISGWSSSYRTSHSAGMISMATWGEVMHREITAMLDRPHVQTIVAHNPIDPDPVADLYGFIAFDLTPRHPYVFYVYIKQHYRNRQHARGLFAAAGIDPARPFAYACRTGAVHRAERLIPMAKWDPMYARFAEPARNEPIIEEKLRHG